MVRKVEATIRRFAMLAPGDRVGLAVSGGRDSVALLHCLGDLAEKFEVSLGVIHVNHCLRGGESGDDERFVAKLAAEMGLPFECARLDAAKAACRQGENLEQAARRQRYGWFGGLVSGDRFDKVATGHTASDQAETVLFRLLRGSAGAGLAGVLPVLDGRVVRPLLDVPRGEVTRYLRSKGAAWREDSSNQSMHYARNRLRHELLPQLERDWNPALDSVLAHTAEWARAEEDYWAPVVAALAAEHFAVRGGHVELSASALRGMPLAVARRLIRHAIRTVRGDLTGVGFEHVERVLRLAAKAAGSGKADLPGCSIQRSHDRLLLTSSSGPRRSPEPAEYRVEVDAPGSYPVPGESSRIRLKLLNPGRWNGVYNDSFQALVDWDKVPKPLYLRNWRAGDRIVAAHRGVARKLKSLFQQGRVPEWDRDGWPVLASPSGRRGAPQSGDTETIVWARKFGSSAAFAPGPDSRVVVEIREIERP